MIRPRRGTERGHFNYGWLDTYHTFSFADYQDPAHTHFRALRVINEDRVEPGQGFGTHPHRDMEIITFVLEGELEHKDSMGNGSVIRPGEIQRMSAGTGVTHSEFNHSPKHPVHLLQIWIFPEKKDLPPGYEQRPFEDKLREPNFFLAVSPDGRDGSVKIHQDVKIYLGRFPKGGTAAHAIKNDRHAWIQIAGGKVEFNHVLLAAGDGAAVSGETDLQMKIGEKSEILLFDLA